MSDSHEVGEPRRGHMVPVVAAALAIGYVAAVLVPPLMPWLVVASATAACALAARSRATRVTVAVAVGLWLLAGLIGAWLLRDRPLDGLAWVLLVLFLLPLPLIPWLYARTFRGGEGEQGTGNWHLGAGSGAEPAGASTAGAGGQRGTRNAERATEIPDPGPQLSDPGPRTPDPRREGGS